MEAAGELRVSARGQMSLPAGTRRRWGLHDGGDVGYVDLGDLLIVVPGGIAALRQQMLDSITPSDWSDGRAGFGDPELANQ